MSKPQRKAFNYKLVGAGFFGLMALAGVAAFVIYLKFVRYDRLAAAHVPADVEFALCVDVEKVVLYEPVRRHLLPLVNEVGKDPKFRPRLQRIQDKTNLELGLDLREVALARGPASADWLLILAGKFPKQGVVRGVSEVLAEEGVAVTLAPDQTSLSGPGGIVLGQAVDGVLILASSRRRLDAALPAQASGSPGLDRAAPLAFVLRGASLAPYADTPASLLAPALNELGQIEQVRGTGDFTNDVVITAHVELKPGPKSPDQRVKGLIAALQRVGGLLPDVAGEKRALAEAKVESEGPSTARVTFPWARTDIDRAALELASLVRILVAGGGLGQKPGNSLGIPLPL